MGIIEFFVVVAVCCVLAWAVCWVLGRFAPGTPPFVPVVIWAVAVLIIVVTLAKALGLYGIDPQIPRLR
jgi:hypothetical protein